MAAIKKLERKSGAVYKITVYSGRDIYGKQQRHYMTWTPPPDLKGRAIERELSRVAMEFEHKLGQGFRPDDPRTFAEYAQYCYELRVQRGDKSQTLARIKRQTARINEYIGHMRLRDIRPYHLNELYKKLAQPGASRWNVTAVPLVNFSELVGDDTAVQFAEKMGVHKQTIRRCIHGQTISKENAQTIEKNLGRSGIFTYSNDDRPMSSGTIRDYHAVISTIMKQAYKEMVIEFDPSDRVTLPKKKPVRESTALELDELQDFIAALNNEPIDRRALFMFLICTGCRRGEAVALTWDKLDLNKKTVLISASAGYTAENGVYTGTTKTDKPRLVALPDELVELLREYQKYQVTMKTQMYDAWTHNNLVFPRWNGEILNPSMINHALDEICTKNDLPHIRPHLFRHTAASILISSGVDVLTVSQMLGHSDISTTLNIYSHALDASRQKTADCISEIVLQSKRA